MNKIQSKKILEEKIMDIPIYAIMCSLIIFLFMSLSFFSVDFLIDAPGISYHDVKIPAIYLYFGLGGSRFGLARALFALFFTMLIAGLWHETSWTFLI